MSNRNNPLRNLILITEVGLSVVIPVVLMIFFGNYLKDRFEADWILIACIVLGILFGAGAGWSLLKRFAPKPSEDSPREEYDLLQDWNEEEDEK